MRTHPQNQTSEARQGFELLLTHLDSNRDSAGEKYEQLRRKLIKFFGWWGCQIPEDLADESFDRLARRLVQGEAVKDLNGYLMGIARLLYKEHVKEQVRHRDNTQHLQQRSQEEVAFTDEESRYQCYEQCLSSLPSQSRELVLTYYQSLESKATEREALARKMQIPLNLLRVRAFRIRQKLGDCLASCMKKSS
ncbi:MAG TPA: hypothetical protein VH437_11930 [Terriglobales bacterium]|jgi:DNA-directed RNA polymerase specialized sigma24 family protein